MHAAAGTKNIPTSMNIPWENPGSWISPALGHGQSKETRMRRTFHSLIQATLVAGALATMVAPAMAAAPPAPPAAMPSAPAAPATPAKPGAPAPAAAAHYSVETTLVGKLLDDPAAVEVLKKMIPTVYANEMFSTMGRESTLKAIQQYEPEALNDANLAKLQAEFNKIPAKN
jgi:hypothetical protein